MISCRLVALGVCLVLFSGAEVFAEEDTVPATLTSFEGSRIQRAIKTKSPADDELFEIEGELESVNDESKPDENADEKFPEIIEPESVNVQKRPVSTKLVTWKSDDFVHRHLVFEESDFERHGISSGGEAKQFLLSSKRFFGKALFLPVTALRGKTLRWQNAPGK